jgi:hypothetical protein
VGAHGARRQGEAVIAVLCLELRVRTLSTPNLREHWAVRHRRSSAQRRAVLFGLRPLGVPELPVEVMLTRIGPKLLDGDNLQGALKAVRDAVAEWLKVDDADTRVGWTYGQETTNGTAKLRVFTKSGHMKCVADMRVRIEIRHP